MQDTNSNKLEEAIRAVLEKKEELKALKISLEKEPNHKTDSDIFSLSIGFDNAIDNLQQIELVHQKIKALDFTLNILTKN